MKVSYRGRVRKINVIPTCMSEFKQVVQQKFLNCHLMSPEEEQSQTMSRILDDSELQGDNASFANLIKSQISQRAGGDEQEESKAGGADSRRSKREKNTVDFSTSVCFYEDSEGDFNVLSEDEDLADATTYMLQHNQKAVKCSIVPKTFFEDLRTEQVQSDLNQSMTWQSSQLNKFQPKAKKEKKVTKQKRKDNDEIPASMMSKIDELVRARVDAEMAAKLEEANRAQSATSQRESTNSISESTGVEYDEALYREQRPKMACLVSADFLNVDAIEGREIALEFNVENKSTMAWPFKPFIQNEKDKSVKQIVDAMLQPGEQTNVRYMFRAPLQQDQKSVHMLLQLVEPKGYEKFCDDTIVVIVNVQSSNQDGDSMFGLGISVVEDDEMRFSKSSEVDDGNEKQHQMLVDRIDDVLNQNRSSSIYEQESIDEGRSMVESMLSPSNLKPALEEDDIIKTTRDLLAQLKNDQDNMDQAAAEEAKTGDAQAQLAKLGNLIAKADEIRQQNP